MGESKRRKAAMGDNYGKPVKRWEVYELLLRLIEGDNSITPQSYRGDDFKVTKQN